MCRVDLRDQPAVASDRFNVVQLDTSERETRQAQAWQEEEEIMSSSQESSASACLEPYAGELLPGPEYGCADERAVWRAVTQRPVVVAVFFAVLKSEDDRLILLRALSVLQASRGGAHNPHLSDTW